MCYGAAEPQRCSQFVNEEPFNASVLSVGTGHSCPRR